MAVEEENEERLSLVKTDSMESRWVYPDDDDSDIDDDDDERSLTRIAGDSDEDDNFEQRLIRTGPRVDSFDVEALEVPGAGHRHEFEVL